MDKKQLAEYQKKYAISHREQLRENERRRYRKIYKNYRSNKEYFVNLKGGKCSACGNKFPICCYDFHHLNPSTKKNNNFHWHNVKREKILERLKDCIMLCANCHRILHFEK